MLQPKSEDTTQPTQTQISGFFFFFEECFNFWVRWLVVALCGLSPVAVNGAALRQCADSRCDGFSSGRATAIICGLQQLRHVSSAVAVHALQSTGSGILATGFTAPRHVESSRTRDQTRVPCIGRQILIQCTIREILSIID